MRKLLVLIAAIASIVGCHAQVPPSVNPKVVLTWTGPASCTPTGTPCTFIISRATVASGATSCPSTSGTNYTPLNQATPVSGNTYTDATPTTTVCYVAQTVQGGLTSIASTASNNNTPMAVPVIPLAPGAPNATSAELVKPEIYPTANMEVASVSAPMQITARLNRR